MTATPTRRFRHLAITLLALLAGVSRGSAQTAREAQDHTSLRITTSDGVDLAAYAFTRSAAVPRPLILLFHQAGSNALGEYGPVVPRLLEAGYDLLAVDQRSGGELFDEVNRTVAALGGPEEDYCAGLPDLEAALAWAGEARPGSRPVLWGSSYSAALVVQLAAAHPHDVAGVLSFSPATGEPMDGCRAEPWARDLDVPVVVFRPRNEAEIPFVAEQLETFREMGHEVHVLDPGRHGSSALVAERVGGDTSQGWAVVLSFLARVAPVGR